MTPSDCRIMWTYGVFHFCPIRHLEKQQICSSHVSANQRFSRVFIQNQSSTGSQSRILAAVTSWDHGSANVWLRGNQTGFFGFVLWRGKWIQYHHLGPILHGCDPIFHLPGSQNLQANNSIVKVFACNQTNLMPMMFKRTATYTRPWNAEMSVLHQRLVGRQTLQAL